MAKLGFDGMPGRAAYFARYAGKRIGGLGILQRVGEVNDCTSFQADAPQPETGLQLGAPALCVADVARTGDAIDDQDSDRYGLRCRG